MAWWRSTVTRLRKAARLSVAEWQLLLRAWLLLLRVGASLRFFGLSRTRDRLARRRVPAARFDSATVYRLVGWAARLHLWEIRCLARSLVLEALIPETELTIGVRRSGTTLEAHAWVEDKGKPVGEGAHALGGFTVLTAGRCGVGRGVGADVDDQS